VELSPDQPHPIDLRWVDELVERSRPHLVVRPEDELLIRVPNAPIKLNRTGVRVLAAVLGERVGIAEVLRREGDSPRTRRELHWFFSDLHAWLSGSLGEGRGRRAVVREPFSADFCRYPVISEVALTYRCDLACGFCYAGCTRGGLPDGWDEARTMTDEQVRTVLEVIRRDARCPSVSFTGGEPTLRRGLPGLVRHAKGAGLKVNLISNGQALTERLVGELADAGLDSAQVSLEGPDARVHDGLVGRAGAFERLWAGIERLRAREVRVHTNTTVSRGNVERLAGIVDLVAERGLGRLTMNLMIPCGAAAGAADDLLVPYAEAGRHVLAVREHASARALDFVWYSPLPLCLFNTVAHGLGNRGCAAADGLLHVSPAGDVLPCSSFRHDEGLGNLLEQTFDEVWESAAARALRKKKHVPEGCRRCPEIAACQGACLLYWRALGTAELRAEAGAADPLCAGPEAVVAQLSVPTVASGAEVRQDQASTASGVPP